MMIGMRGLRKSFRNHVVLDGIDLDVAAGTICALLGPKGAGKPTTARMTAMRGSPATTWHASRTRRAR